MAPFVFTQLCQGHGPCIWQCQAKPLRRVCYATGMWNSPCCLTEESLFHADSSKWSYLVALGTLWHLLVPRAVLKDIQYHLGESAVRTTAKLESSVNLTCLKHRRCSNAAQDVSSTLYLHPSLSQPGGLCTAKGDAVSLCSQGDEMLGAGWGTSSPSAWKSLPWAVCDSSQG